MMFRYAVILAITLVSTLPAYSQAQQSVPIKIGFVLTLTGKWSEYGEAQRNALELARSERPELFKNIEFLYEDCQYHGHQAISAFHKLRSQDKVDLVFVWGVEPSLALYPIADRFKMPLLVSGQLSKDLPQNKYVIRTINYAEQYSEKLVEYLRKEGFRRIGLLKAELSFYDDRSRGIRMNLADNQSLEVVHELLPNDIDLNTVVTSLRKKDYDIIGVYLTPRQIIKYYRTAANQGVKLPTFGATPFQSKHLLEETGDEMNGAIYVHNDVDSDFHRRYIERYGKDDQLPWAANAYDVAILAGQVLGKITQRPDKDKILSLFTSFKERKGAGGAFRVVKSKPLGAYFEYPVVIKQIQDKRFNVIYR